MEKRDIVRHLKDLGWKFSREGGSHEIWTHPGATMFLSLPRRRMSNTVAHRLLKNAKEYVH